MVQFRKSKKVGPFRVTLSHRGVSTSVGAGPFRITHGADGKVRRTIRIPGAGIWDTRVVGQPSSGRVQQGPPQFVRAAGWYPDPTGEASWRYWDGDLWTSITDPPPDALRQHQCPAVGDLERYRAVGKVRGLRFIVAALRDEDNQQILDEFEGCAVCLGHMISFLASEVALCLVSDTQGDKAYALAHVEKLLAQYVDKALGQV